MESLFSLLELEKIFDGNPGLYNLRGCRYIEIRNIEKALENFEKALKLDPENLTVQFNLAEALYVSHDYAKALKAFTELLPHFKDTDKNGIIPSFNSSATSAPANLTTSRSPKSWKVFTAPWTTPLTTTASRQS